jgi:hypothetical protein
VAGVHRCVEMQIEGRHTVNSRERGGSGEVQPGISWGGITSKRFSTSQALIHDAPLLLNQPTGTSITLNMQCIQNVSSSRSKASLVFVQNPDQSRVVASDVLVQGSLKRGARQDIEFGLFHLPRMASITRHIR